MEWGIRDEVGASPLMSTLTQSLWEKFTASRDPEARRLLLEQYIGLVHHIARQIGRQLSGDVELDDLVSAGTLGLVGALEGFDPDRGLAFSTYATPRIRGSILDELRSRDWVPRSVRNRRRRMDAAIEELEARLGRAPEPREVAQLLNIDLDTYWRWREDVDGGVLVSLNGTARRDNGSAAALDEVLRDPNHVEPHETLSRDEEILTLREAIAELPAKERSVLALYYYEELRLREIAEILHLTESRISQIRTQALKRLRERIRSD